MSNAPAALSAAQLGERWQLSRETVIRMWKLGQIPPPMNPQRYASYRWPLAVVEAFERGEWNAA